MDGGGDFQKQREGCDLLGQDYFKRPHPSQGMWPFLLDKDMQTIMNYYTAPLDYNLLKDIRIIEPFKKDSFIIFETKEYSCFALDFILEITLRKGKFFCIPKKEELKKFSCLNGSPFLTALNKILESICILQEGKHTLHPITRSLFGYLGFNFVSLLEPKLLNFLPIEDEDVFLGLPSKIIFFDHLSKKGFVIADDKSFVRSFSKDIKIKKHMDSDRWYRVKNLFFFTSKKSFLKKIDKAKEYITNGDIFQVVLSVRFCSKFFGDPLLVYEKLKVKNPSPYMFLLSLSNLIIIGSSPETLVKCRDSILEERPIAGTRSKPTNDYEISKVRDELLLDPKERAEHVMLVDLSRNDLGKVAEFGSVYVEDFMFLEEFSHVIHITSSVKAKLKNGMGVLDVLKATFPAGTVSGAPKIRAMEIIGELEDCPRGPYGGGVGWLGLDKKGVNLDLGIIIRTFWIKDEMAIWQAGAGIVSDSDKEKEWNECLKKAQVITETLTEGVR